MMKQIYGNLPASINNRTELITKHISISSFIIESTLLLVSLHNQKAFYIYVLVGMGMGRRMMMSIECK